MGKWRYILNILNLDTDENEVVSFMVQPLYPRRSHRHPLDTGLGGSQIRLGVVATRTIPVPGKYGTLAV
jgi:hypothetical protein